MYQLNKIIVFIFHEISSEVEDEARALLQIEAELHLMLYQMIDPERYGNANLPALNGGGGGAGATGAAVWGCPYCDVAALPLPYPLALFVLPFVWP